MLAAKARSGRLSAAASRDSHCPLSKSALTDVLSSQGRRDYPKVSRLSNLASGVIATLVDVVGNEGLAQRPSAGRSAIAGVQNPLAKRDANNASNWLTDSKVRVCNPEKGSSRLARMRRPCSAKPRTSSVRATKPRFSPSARLAVEAGRGSGAAR